METEYFTLNPFIAQVPCFLEFLVDKGAIPYGVENIILACPCCTGKALMERRNEGITELVFVTFDKGQFFGEMMGMVDKIIVISIAKQLEDDVVDELKDDMNNMTIDVLERVVDSLIVTPVVTEKVYTLVQPQPKAKPDIQTHKPAYKRNKDIHG